jgi:hypothetical protein
LAFASNCFAVDDSSVDRAGLRYDPALLANPGRKGGVASATAAYTVASEIAEGDALLSYGGDIGADLIVAGGYGRSRLRKLAFCHALVVDDDARDTRGPPGARQASRLVQGARRAYRQSGEGC